MKQLNVKQHLFKNILYVAIFLSLNAIVVNLITDLPLSVNLKWVFLFCLSFFIIIYLKKKSFSNLISFVSLLFVIVVFMPLGFINGGGSKSDFIAFLFFTLIVTTYILEGRYQKICVAMIVLIFIGLHVFEYLFSPMIPVYNMSSRFYDRLIQIPVMLILSYMIIRTFADAYNESSKTLFHYANYDMLTGLLNRWALRDLLKNKFDSSKYEGYLVLLDIDNFKLVNDNKGHKIGDDVLRQFGVVLKRYFDNNQNLICRWGGDEFVIFFFDTSEKLDSMIEKARDDFLSYSGNIESLVDISVGITSLEGCMSVEDAFIKSDQLMYKQKCSKKN